MDVQTTQQNRKTLKPNDSIQYKMQTTHEWIKAKVLGGAKKTTRKNKHWYSHLKEDANKEKKSVNLEQLQWELINDKTVNLVLKQNRVSDETTAAK